MIEFESWGPESSIEQREAIIRLWRSQDRQSTPEVLLITCDRVERYWGDGPASNTTVEHLFSLAAGLLSPLIGENAILGQIRRAYEDYRINLGHYSNYNPGQGSSDIKQTLTHSKGLHQLFQMALACGKKVRSESTINKGAMTYPQLVLDAIRQKFALNNASILLVAANDMNNEIIKRLSGRCKSLCLISRNHEKARRLAVDRGANWAPFDQLAEHCQHYDVIVSATSAPHQIFHPGIHTFKPGALLLDLAVPRDFHPTFAQNPQWQLFSVNDLEAKVEQNLAMRYQAINTATTIVHDAVKTYLEKTKVYS